MVEMYRMCTADKTIKGVERQERKIFMINNKLWLLK